MRICKLENCDKQHYARDHCHYHYSLYARPSKPCREEDCERRSYVKGRCIKHYHYFRRTPKMRWGERTYCAVADCGKRIGSGRKYCVTHQKRLDDGVSLSERNTKYARGEDSTTEYPFHGRMKKARLEKLKQVGARCEDCGKKKHKRNLQIHHLDESKDNHTLDNLKLLCHKCHMGNYHIGRNGRPLKKIKGFGVREIAEKVGCVYVTAERHLSGKVYSLKYGEAIDRLT